MSLYDSLKYNQFKGMDMEQVEFMAFQLLQCLTVLYEHHIIHTDLKPENILLKCMGSLQIKVSNIELFIAFKSFEIARMYP
jgi:serine/threonine protein kinase